MQALRRKFSQFFHSRHPRHTLASDMIRSLAALLILVALLAVAVSPVAASGDRAGAGGAPAGSAIDAQEEGHGEEEAGATSERRDGLDSVVIWSLVSLGIFALVLGAFYFFKRQVGGFPENPEWVAPITIMPSKDFADDGDFGEAGTTAHGSAGH